MKTTESKTANKEDFVANVKMPPHETWARLWASAGVYFSALKLEVKQISSVKSQISTWGFAGHTISMKTTNICHCSVKAITDNM